jgi:hypothetical protein
MEKLLSKYKALLWNEMKQMLLPYHSKALHLYGFPTIPNQMFLLRPTLNSNLAGVLCKVCSLVVEKLEPFVVIHNPLCSCWNLQIFKVQKSTASLDIVTCFTVVQDEKVIQVIRNTLLSVHTLVEWSKLQAEAKMKLLELCLKATQLLTFSSNTKKE